MARLLLAFAICALAGALPDSAAAFERSRQKSGQCLFWGERTIPWTMNERGDPELGFERSLAAFQRSFDAWQSVGCSDVTFSFQGKTDETRIGFSEGDETDNLMIFRTQDCRDVAPQNAPCHSSGGCANEFDCWDHGSNVIAVTTTTFLQRSGEILDADIEMNASSFRFTDVDGPPCVADLASGCVATDVQNTATHEIGHMIGLDHTPVRNATMFASAPRGETSKRRLSQDDVDGICSIYPTGEPTVLCQGAELEEAGGCDCQSGRGAPGAMVVLMVLWLLSRMARRAA